MKSSLEEIQRTLNKLFAISVYCCAVTCVICALLCLVVIGDLYLKGIQHPVMILFGVTAALLFAIGRGLNIWAQRHSW